MVFSIYGMEGKKKKYQIKINVPLPIVIFPTFSAAASFLRQIYDSHVCADYLFFF
jgi:hypothetical protein